MCQVTFRHIATDALPDCLCKRPLRMVTCAGHGNVGEDALAAEDVAAVGLDRKDGFAEAD